MQASDDAGTLACMNESDDEGLGDAVRRWVNEILAYEQIDATRLARRAGVSQPTLSRLLRGEVSQPSRNTIRALIADSPIAVPARIRKLIDGQPSSARERGVNALQAVNGLPVWSVHPIERDGLFRINATAFEHFRRPLNIAATHKLAAFYAPDDTMAPRWLAGEPVLVDLMRPAATGGFALVRLATPESPNDEDAFLFRRYDGRRDGAVLLGTATGEHASIRIPLAHVLEVRRVLGWEDLLNAA